MPILKHTLGNGRMNKDLDERLVNEGDYRDANNIEITTSEGSNAGVVQTLKGNTKHSTIASIDNITGVYDIPNTASGTCVACVSAPDENKIYYFVTSNLNTITGAELDVAKDYIMEYDTVSETHKYVFVDIHRVKTTIATTTTDSTTFHIALGAGTTANQTGIRLGMRVAVGDYTDSDNIRVTDISYDTEGGTNKWKITVSEAISTSASAAVTFRAPRVLNFQRNNLITGINVLDDFLFWTDNEHEPKKINIKRCMLGTGGTEYLKNAGNGGIAATTNAATNAVFNGESAYFHTRLVVDNEVGQLKVATDATGKKAVYVNESNITLIRTSPNTPLDLDMYRTSVSRIKANGEENLTSSIVTGSFTVIDAAGEPNPVEIGEHVTIESEEAIDIRVNDYVNLAATSGFLANDTSSYSDDIRDIRAKVVSVPDETAAPETIYTGPFVLEVLSIKQGVSSSDTEWALKLEDRDPLFNFKFPRFSYRYKYQDGEYSTFAPWSEIAFLPDSFDYEPKKGHNLGMMNRLRGLKIKGYHAQENNIPRDVVEIDILYKETNNPTVYTVKTIRPSDGHPLWPDLSVDYNARGVFELTTDMIHSIVPSNQLIRPWDNVPRKALAQDVSANRVIFGNYLQNYDVIQYPKIISSFDSRELGKYTTPTYPEPSVKSMRDYQVGVVFSDRYGRETPVLTNENSSVRLPKQNSKYVNRIKVSLDTSIPIPSWAEYYSYYIKETSVEYYTISMDRWYDAADGNIWISFPSSERNKIDDGTFLILKKAHSSNTIVEEKAKYKVLAIESEAPRFIKTRKVTLGKVYNTNNEIIGSPGFGFPLPGRTKVTVSGSAFRSAFGKHMEEEMPDRLFMRIWKGGGEGSRFYRVSKLAGINIGTSDGVDIPGDYQLTLEKVFGPDVSFTSTDETYETRVDGLAIELLEEEVQQRPEFEGRFFVKIFKDQALSDYVARRSDDDWYVTHQWGIDYINNNGYLNAGTRVHHPISPPGGSGYSGAPGGFLGVIPRKPVYPINGYDLTYNEDIVDGNTTGGFLQGDRDIDWDQYGDNDWDIVGFARHYSNWKYPYARVHPTEHDWSGLTGYDEDHIPLGKAYKFMDIDPIGYSIKEHMDIDSIRGICGGEDDPEPHHWRMDTPFANGARAYWVYQLEKRRFFIDGCTAFTWTSYAQDYPGNKFTGARLNVNPAINAANSAPVANFSGWHYKLNYFSDGPHNYWSSGNDGAYSLKETFNPGDMNTSAEWMGGSNNDAFANGYYDWADGNGTEEEVDEYIEWILTKKNGVPSRGIWTTDNGYCAMDLSWVGWQADGYPWKVEEYMENNADHIPVRLDQEPDDAATSTAAREFIEELVKPGTKWRFKRDPDKVVYTSLPFTEPYTTQGYDCGLYKNDANIYTGAFGIRNINMGEQEDDRQMWAGCNIRQRWTVVVDPPIGSGPLGYNPIHGTDPSVVTSVTDANWRRALHHDGMGDPDYIEILSSYSMNSDSYSSNPAIWETEPKEAAELDIYYQASRLIPLHVNDRTCEEYIPVGSCFYKSGWRTTWAQQSQADLGSPMATNNLYVNKKYTITSVNGDGTLGFESGILDALGSDVGFLTPTSAETTAEIDVSNPDQVGYETGDTIEIELPNGTFLFAEVVEDLVTGDTTVKINTTNTTQFSHSLGWSNCWSFGNGAESDRIRDDFNAPQMDNGVKASATIGNERVKEEHKKYGMIWSGLYNANAKVNETNQFIAGEKITKDINPSHGSIQALKTGDTLLRIFCEDKVLKAYTNRDALYNADGKTNVVASNATVGDVTAYQGDFGISKNPESLVKTPYNHYFVDVNRGKVLALSGEGVRPISEIGMKDYFADAMGSYVVKAIGTYDERKNEYNVTLNKAYSENNQYLPTEQITVSYNEGSKGWASFKSFYKTQSTSPASVQGLEHGISQNNNYYTFFDGHIWKHHSNETRNNFYGQQHTSDFTVLFNDVKEQVKSFTTIGYEGSQAKISNWDDATAGVDNVGFYNNDSSTGSGTTTGTTLVSNVSDNEYFNLGATINGWYAESITTDLQTCGSLEFKDKEGKWFGYPTGETTTLSNLDEKEFSVQGLGVATMTHSDSSLGGPITITVNNNSTSSGGASWD